jgi:hypothetical protein
LFRGFNYSVSDIDKYIIDEYPTFLTTNYFNNMIVNFIDTSKYDSRNDKYRKLNSKFNNKTLNLDRYPTCIYSQIEDYLASLNEFDRDYFIDFISIDIYFLLDLVVKRLKEYDYNNNLPVIF